MLTCCSGMPVKMGHVQTTQGKTGKAKNNSSLVKKLSRFEFLTFAVYSCVLSFKGWHLFFKFNCSGLSLHGIN